MAGIAVKPAEYTWRQLAGAGALAGIGFTMSLFIAEQAFPSASDFSAAKIPVFAASILSAIVGIALLWGASFQNAYRRGAAVREHAISGARLRRIVNRRFLMILPAGATVAVADGETVRLFRNTGVKPGVHLIEIATAPPAPLHSDSGARHHVGSGNLDGRRLDEDDFAAAAAAFLNRLSLDGTIKHLVVVSDPRTLGEMRKHFHSHLRGRIMREFAKEFSRRPLEEIASLIADA